MEIQCNKCESPVPKMDPAPLYRKFDDAYVVRQITCKQCPQKMTGTKMKSPSTLHYPTGLDRHTITMVQVVPWSQRGENDSL